MRDSFYRSLVSPERDYDAVIDWIKENNSAAERSGDAEEFAVLAVHSCINAILFNTDGNMHCSTGMCMAVRHSADPKSKAYKEVILGIAGLGLYMSQKNNHR
jgi:hypothetical protein